MDAGNQLRHARQERRLSLRQVANVTKVPVAALEAIELNEIDRLPGGIFTRGFVRAYAAAVGLDPHATVDDFLAQFNQEPAVEPSVPAAVPDADPRARRTPILGSLALGGFLVLYSAYIASTSAEPSPAALLPAAPVLVSGGDIRLPAPPPAIVDTPVRSQPVRTAVRSAPTIAPESKVELSESDAAADPPDAAPAVPDQQPPPVVPAPDTPVIVPPSSEPDPGR